MMEIRRTIGYIEVQPGAEWRDPPSVLQFQTLVRCTGTSPDRFIGLIMVEGEEVLQTAELPDDQRARREAQNLLRQRLVDIFRHTLRLRAVEDFCFQPLRTKRGVEVLSNSVAAIRSPFDSSTAALTRHDA